MSLRHVALPLALVVAGIGAALLASSAIPALAAVALALAFAAVGPPAARPEEPATTRLHSLAMETDLQRSVFEVTTELVGCLDHRDALDRFTTAVHTYWSFETIDLWIWYQSSWTCVSTGEAQERPALRGAVHLPTVDEDRLVLDLSVAVSGQALLVAEHAAPQPTLIARTPGDQRAVAEVLRGQLSLALRRVILYQELEELAHHDPLTGTARRWYGEQRLLECLRDGTPVALAMVDIDHFKNINDQFGHRSGDRVLASIGRELERQLRPTDLVSRYGGEEFLIMLPGAPAENALGILSRLLRSVAALSLEVGPVTCSAGLTIRADEDDQERIIDRADQACYRAKGGGRNRVVFLGSDGSLVESDIDRSVGPA
jgi:diguanylate cyclase (GGDEF)-like protein